MTTKEKAKQLFDKFEYKVMSDINGTAHKGKQMDCADIVCNEMIKQCEDSNFGGFALYWVDVKREVSLL